jgi:hypothetical protein
MLFLKYFLELSLSLMKYASLSKNLLYFVHVQYGTALVLG